MTPRTTAFVGRPATTEKRRPRRHAGVQPALTFAAEHPDRVARLVVMDSLVEFLGAGPRRYGGGLRGSLIGKRAHATTKPTAKRAPGMSRRGCTGLLSRPASAVSSFLSFEFIAQSQIAKTGEPRLCRSKTPASRSNHL